MKGSSGQIKEVIEKISQEVCPKMKAPGGFRGRIWRMKYDDVDPAYR